MHESLWDKYAISGYDALRSLIPYEQLLEELRRSAELSARDSVFVAGCGTGNFEEHALRTLPTLAVQAVDISAQMLARARAKCAQYPHISYLQADLCQRLPFEDCCFDVAVMNNVLYTLPDRPERCGKYLACCARVGVWCCVIAIRSRISAAWRKCTLPPCMPCRFPPASLAGSERCYCCRRSSGSCSATS